MIWERCLPGPGILIVKQKELQKAIGEWEEEMSKEWPDNYDNEYSGPWQEPAEYMAASRIEVCDRIGANITDLLAYKEGRLLGYTSHCRAFESPYACREALRVAQKDSRYKHVFKTGSSNAETWFDLEVDTLYLRAEMLIAKPGSNGNIIHVLGLSDRPTDLPELTSGLKRIAIDMYWD